MNVAKHEAKRKSQPPVDLLHNIKNAALASLDDEVKAVAAIESIDGSIYTSAAIVKARTFDEVEIFTSLTLHLLESLPQNAVALRVALYLHLTLPCEGFSVLSGLHS